jgi:hypothetical protein
MNLDSRHVGGVDLDGGRALEMHAEEEWARSVNLDGGRGGGVVLNGERAMEAHVEEERGAGMEAHTEDMEEVAWWRAPAWRRTWRTRRRSRRR